MAGLPETDHTIPVQPVFSRQDERGSFTEVVNKGNWQALICGRMIRGAILGQHYHRETTIFLFLQSGKAEVWTEDVISGAKFRTPLDAGQGLTLSPFQAHAVRFLTESDYILLKSRAYSPDAPDTYHHIVNVPPLDGTF
ncbi:MAG: hypothetical protein HQL43_00495 [Alphaproteobacteria bacterium]|nr:hypothetical protein [Alphaproteobacteria bacterium]